MRYDTNFSQQNRLVEVHFYPYSVSTYVSSPKARTPYFSISVETGSFLKKPPNISVKDLVCCGVDCSTMMGVVYVLIVVVCDVYYAILLILSY
jgi:hypothetical protein